MMDIEAIRKRCEAATLGEWRTEEQDTPEQTRSWGLRLIGPESLGHDNELDSMKPEDAAFIAAARADVPNLLDEVEELRATLLNERGEGPPPCEGWVFGLSPVDAQDGEPIWHNGQAFVWRGPRTVHTDTMTWWWAVGITGGTDGGTARAAMVAASAALGSKS
jgi:hypothetical protein